MIVRTHLAKMLLGVLLCAASPLFAEPVVTQQEYQQAIEQIKQLKIQREQLVKQLEAETLAREKALQAAELHRETLLKLVQELKTQLHQKNDKIEQAETDSTTLRKLLVEVQKSSPEIMPSVAQKSPDADTKDKAKEPAKKAASANDAMTPITETPGLPRVLLIGDSISIGYTPAVRELLKGKANVHRVLTNCGPTKGPSKVEGWLTDKRTGGEKWDVIHFNFGLHDLKHSDEKGTIVDVTETSKRQVSPEDYEKNLREIVGKLKATGAKLIWCSTTPVPKGAKGRVTGDEVLYNEIALKVMKENSIAVDDLYAFALPKLDKIQNKADVHFSTAGSKELAGQVVSTIEAAMKK